ncbi:endonuclease III [Ktedonobacter sp. SOSP1-85]|uniref:endonuclease III domain-containing protein n=1 Tax=Ktedonobacter sp. SOSP1-85 TaxID=2778367 RepID=UPI001915F264|nr:endonuclease III [Ktedonobacter sp. SOSP1-85]GHO77433.1 endonuclease III [Ktedonobacter sp. SOSP1-85]
MGITPGALEHLERVYDLLIGYYGEPTWEPDHDPLGGLIGTILSQHTSDINSGRAYRQLIEKFPTWEEVRDAPTHEVAEAIKSGGLANVKAPRIQSALHTLSEWQQAKGDTRSLSAFLQDELKGQPLEEAWRYLQQMPGVGPKTAACVLLFNMGRPLMPIDTHLHRLTHRLGLIGPKVSADQAHTIFLKALPPEWAYTLHVNLIRHGRTICHAQRPKCPQCPLISECAYAGSVNPEETMLPTK